MEDTKRVGSVNMLLSDYDKLIEELHSTKEVACKFIKKRDTALAVLRSFLLDEEDGIIKLESYEIKMLIERLED